MSTDAFKAPKTTRSYRSKKVYVEVDGQMLLVAEGSFFTRSPFEQWHGWSSKGGRRQRGLRDLLPDKMRDLLFDLRRAEALIDASVTYKSYDGEITKLIDTYDEEQLQEDLESLRDSINETLNTWSLRRPLKRRVELMREVTVERGATPDEAAAAKAAIERLQKRLDNES